MIKVANNLVKASSSMLPFTKNWWNRNLSYGPTKFVNHSDDPYSPALAPVGENPMSMAPHIFHTFKPNQDSFPHIFDRNQDSLSYADYMTPQQFASMTNTAISTNNENYRSGNTDTLKYIHGTQNIGSAYRGGRRLYYPGNLDDAYTESKGQRINKIRRANSRRPYYYRLPITGAPATESVLHNLTAPVLGPAVKVLNRLYDLVPSFRP